MEKSKVNKYGTSDEVHSGRCTLAHYNDTEKVIKFILKFSNGREQGFEWPITMFSFSPSMDKDREMRKTAELMKGKLIDVMVKNES